MVGATVEKGKNTTPTNQSRRGKGGDGKKLCNENYRIKRHGSRPHLGMDVSIKKEPSKSSKQSDGKAKPGGVLPLSS